jgi:hypothetical protein
MGYSLKPRLGSLQMLNAVDVDQADMHGAIRFGITDDQARLCLKTAISSDSVICEDAVFANHGGSNGAAQTNRYTVGMHQRFVSFAQGNRKTTDRLPNGIRRHSVDTSHRLAVA